MSIIRLPIDTKSLYYNVKNDNRTGHTATVATPLKQGESIHKELARILEIPECSDSTVREELISLIKSKSRVDIAVRNVFVFDKLSVNGIMLENVPSYCIYLREETDPKKFHYGRQKVHYPTTLTYESENISINNKAVIKAVSKTLNSYAFVVEAFEYNAELAVLNFDATVVGENSIPYSKLFVNQKGVGNKFTNRFKENADVYDREIIALREHFGYDAVGPENFEEYVDKNYQLAINLLNKQLQKRGATNIKNIKEKYPYSIYDVECVEKGIKEFFIIKHTSTKSKYFNLPIEKVKFLNDFPNTSYLVLITDINDSPNTNYYSAAELNGLEKSVNSIIYLDRNH